MPRGSHTCRFLSALYRKNGSSVLFSGMDSIVYAAAGRLGSKGSSCGPKLIDLTAQNECYQRDVVDQMKDHNNSVGLREIDQTVHSEYKF